MRLHEALAQLGDIKLRDHAAISEPKILTGNEWIARQVDFGEVEISEIKKNHGRTTLRRIIMPGMVLFSEVV